MKYAFLLLSLLSFPGFASEREDSVSSCDRVQQQISAKYRELSEISSRMMVISHDGPESYSVSYYEEDENCESVTSEYHILQRRRERVEQELVRLRADRKRECPRVYPE